MTKDNNPAIANERREIEAMLYFWDGALKRARQDLEHARSLCQSSVGDAIFSRDFYTYFTAALNPEETIPHYIASNAGALLTAFRLCFAVQLGSKHRYMFKPNLVGYVLRTPEKFICADDVADLAALYACIQHVLGGEPTDWPEREHSLEVAMHKALRDKGCISKAVVKALQEKLTIPLYVPVLDFTAELVGHLEDVIAGIRAQLDEIHKRLGTTIL